MRVEDAFQRALSAAIAFRGATAPNPAVGAAALSGDGTLVGVAAHERAGTEHAEAKLLREIQEREGTLASVQQVIVTLEPCNHFGRTPPCTEALLQLPALKDVWIGTRDPNPRVPGQGAARLQAAGVRTSFFSENSPEATAAQRLIAPFTNWVLTGRPLVVLKTAHRFSDLASRNAAYEDAQRFFENPVRLRESMIPPAGQKTFTTEASLQRVHQIRRESDALLTGVGTLLADAPEFTVRRVPDHPGKKRPVLILDRQGRTPPSWIAAALQRGLLPEIEKRGEWSEILESLGERGIHQLLIEAGPTLTGAALQAGIVDRHEAIFSCPGEPDLWFDSSLC